MKQTIYEIPELALTVGKNCLLASIHDVFSYYKIEANEDILYFICEGLRFLWKSNDQCNLSDSFYYDRNEYIVKGISDIYECQLEYCDNFNLKKMKKLIHNNTPIISLLDPRCAKYNTRRFQPEGRDEMHSVIIYGYSDESFAVADSTASDDNAVFSCIKTEISYKDAKEGCKGFFYFSKPPQKVLSPEKIIWCIKNNIQNFLYPTNQDGYVRGLLALKEAFKYYAVNDVLAYSGELRFLFQAYFIPSFIYLESILKSLEGFEEIIKKIMINKSGWNRFYYKFLCRPDNNPDYIKNTSEKAFQLMEDYSCVLLNLLSILKCIKCKREDA